MPRRYPLLRFAVLVLGVACLAVTVPVVGVPAPDDWAEWVAHADGWAPVWAVAGTVLLAAALVPRVVLAGAAGLLFGPLVGAAVVLAGSASVLCWPSRPAAG